MRCIAGILDLTIRETTDLPAARDRGARPGALLMPETWLRASPPDGGFS